MCEASIKRRRTVQGIRRKKYNVISVTKKVRGTKDLDGVTIINKSEEAVV